jgi:hypothetical protein
MLSHAGPKGSTALTLQEGSLVSTPLQVLLHLIQSIHKRKKHHISDVFSSIQVACSGGVMCCSASRSIPRGLELLRELHALATTVKRPQTALIGNHKVLQTSTLSYLALFPERHAGYGQRSSLLLVCVSSTAKSGAVKTT